MAEVKDITPGSGFLSATGELKSKEQLAADNKTTDTKASNQGSTQAKSVDAAKADFSGQVGDAIGKVKGRFLEQANDIANVIHVDEQNINKAEKVVKEQLTTAKELKAAIKDGDSDKADKLREKLQKLADKRDQLAGDIEKDNANAVGSRVKNISFGNEQKGVVSTTDVKFSKSEDTELKKAKDVEHLIQNLKADKAALDDQRKELRATNQHVKDIVGDTKKQLSSIQKNVLDSYDKASAASTKLASQISQGGQAYLAHNINENVAAKLLAM